MAPAETSGRRPRAATFRGALLITLAALATTLLALTLQYLQTVRAIEAQIRARVDAEAASLIGRYEAGGVAAVVAFLDRQQPDAGVRDFLYLLAGPGGEPIAGNLLAWPRALAEPGQYGFATDVISSRGIERRWVEARAVGLGTGYRLLVGQFADLRSDLRARYLSSLFWSMMATALVGLALGWWLSRRALMFVEVTADAGERLLAGHLSERLPVSGRHDEYDRLAEIINACFADLERTVDSLRAATDGLAHDLKTPLTRIKARLALARLHHHDPAELRHAIEETDADLAVLLRAINEMLELARAEATSAETFVPVDLGMVAADAIELYRPAAEERGIEIVADLASAPMDGSRALLARAIANLLDNAIKHTPSGGRIQVSTGTFGSEARISVADTGPGIAPPDRERALTRFVRLDPARGIAGTGLGLSLVQTVARVHRGALHLEDNAPGLRAELSFRSR